jgi:hypothetical protein
MPNTSAGVLPLIRARPASTVLVDNPNAAPNPAATFPLGNDPYYFAFAGRLRESQSSRRFDLNKGMLDKLTFPQ